VSMLFVLASLRGLHVDTGDPSPSPAQKGE